MSVFFGILSLEESFLINTKRGAQDISIYMQTWRPSKATLGCQLRLLSRRGRQLRLLSRRGRQLHLLSRRDRQPR